LPPQAETAEQDYARKLQEMQDAISKELSEGRELKELMKKKSTKLPHYQLDQPADYSYVASKLSSTP
jgi:hypothetical protein